MFDHSMFKSAFSEDQEAIKKECGDLIYSEYEYHVSCTPGQLFEWLNSIYVNITRESSDELYHTYF